MKFALHDYQTAAVNSTTTALLEAFERAQKTPPRSTAVSLTAVTGAGKTVIATSVIETLLHGNDGHEGDPGLTFLWLTDDPSLNEQTRRKMLVASDKILPGQLVTIDERFDQPTLDEGAVYFLNIQKLGKGSTRYVKTGDRRTHSLWDSIRETVRTRGDRFVLIIDEAHRGTSSTGNGDRTTIASRLIHGDVDKGEPATPVVLGISATPERFHTAVIGSGRLLDPVEVDVDEVRNSGLIKDLVKISYPTDTQPGDATLLEQAVEDVRAFDESWSEHVEASALPPVRPALVVQVKAGTSDAELAAHLDTIMTAWPGLDDRAVAHSFQDHSRLNLGDHNVRYIAPQNIQDDQHLRVVFFKEALTTGWDCPRAEVMISLRSAQDHTYIAQLIGRMVRTPLAQRIPTSDHLNSVSLFLPHFDATSVDEVIAKLRAGDEQVASELTSNAVVCRRNTALPEKVWEAAEALPTYTRPAKAHRNEVARLNSFAQLLASSDIDKDAPTKAKDHIVAHLDTEVSRLGSDLTAAVEQLSRLAFATKTVSVLDSDAEATTGTASRALSSRNVEDLYRTARRKLGDAAADWYWDTLCEREENETEEDADAEAAKIKAAALASEPTVIAAVSAAAATLIGNWRKDHHDAISALGADRREKFYAIFRQSKEPQQIAIVLPGDIAATAPKGATRYSKHLYANGGGTYPADFNEWEEKVVTSQLPGVVAWYRNPIGGSRAVGVPYELGGEKRTMYPDFIFFREVDDGTAVADIIDPHAPNQGDTVAKWLGLAAYATEHSTHLGKVYAVIADSNENLVSIDLRSDVVVTELGKCTSEAEIRKLFEDYGGLL